MDPDTKRQFDAFATLEERAWDSFNKRRTYEWKACFAVWTVFAVFIGNMLTREHTFINGNTLTLLVGIFGGIITILHACWVCRVSAANQSDKLTANRYKLLMQEILYPKLSDVELAGLNDENTGVIRKDLNPSRRCIFSTCLKCLKKELWFLDWNHCIQIIITVVLCAGTIVAAWVAANSESSIHEIGLKFFWK